MLLGGVGLLTSCASPEPTLTPPPHVAPTADHPTPTATLIPTPTPTATPGNESPEGYEVEVWQYRIDRSFEPTECPTPPDLSYAASYYQGPLIDTHFHLPHIPDGAPGSDEGDPQKGGISGRPNAGPSADEERRPFYDQLPLLGMNISVDEIACALITDGSAKAFAFFPVFPSIEWQLLEVARRTMERYPHLYVPFIMTPGPHDVPPTVDGATLSRMLASDPGLFKGYGEIGLYDIPGRPAEDFPPDAPIFQGIYPVTKAHHLLVYLHPGEGHANSLARAVSENPQINFVVHGPEIREDVTVLMDAYPNIYYTVNGFFGDTYLLRPEETTESFMAFTENYTGHLVADLGGWRKEIEAHPDRFMWGTDRGGPAVWTYDLEVGLRLVDYGRAFIGQLDPAVQELFAHRNAERLIEAAGLGGG